MNVLSSSSSALTFVEDPVVTHGLDAVSSSSLSWLACHLWWKVWL